MTPKGHFEINRPLVRQFVNDYDSMTKMKNMKCLETLSNYPISREMPVQLYIVHSVQGIVH